jgi:hypothetical protein
MSNAAELTVELQETNRRLTGAIDALRDEIGALKVEVAKINNNLSWAKWIGGSVAAIVTTGVIGVFGLAYQAGGQVAKIESSVAVLQRTTEEMKADFKARDTLVAAVVADTRKMTEDVRSTIKGQSADMTRLQESLDRINDGIGRVIMRPRQP